MTWTYSISAVVAPRLLTRVVMIFDQQLLTLSDVSWKAEDGVARISIRVECAEALARRMEAKLWSLQDVRVVLVGEGGEADPLRG